MSAVKNIEPTPLSGSDILALDDRSQLQRISVPEWNTDVWIRVLSGHERDRFELKLTDGISGKGRANVRAFLAVMCLCDESGKRLFKDSDTDALGEKSAIALDRILDVAKKFNALDEKDVAALEGN